MPPDLSLTPASRIRRVKCDETKPSCLRCAAQKRTCDGYPPPSHPVMSRRALAVAVRSSLCGPGPAARVLAGPQTAEDVACFDFFRHRTAPMTGSFFPSEFWGGRLLQVAHAQPAVWHAAVALGALHRRWELGFAPAGAVGVARDAGAAAAAAASIAEFSEKAAGAHARSIELAKGIRDPLELLVLSLSLMAVTNILGRWVENRVHGAAGMRLLGEIKRERAAGCRGRLVGSDFESVAESFARMDLQNLTFSESRAPYPDFENESKEEVLMHADLLEDILLPGDSFESFSQAGFQLFALIRRFLLLAGMAENMPPEEFGAAQDEIRFQLSLWEQMIKGYLQQARVADKDKDRLGLLTVKLYHAVICLFLRADVTGPQTNWDACLPHFERMIGLAGMILNRNQNSHAAPAFVSLEPGIIIPLYLSATRCRHPVLRRRALALLRQANSQEGRWHSIGAAAVAERIMQLEEENLVGLISDDAYFRFMALDVSKDEAFVEMTSKRLSAETEDYWLGGDGYWTTTHTWDGIVVIPEASRVVMTGITADTEVGRIEVEVMFSGGDTVLRRFTEEVIVSDWQAKWSIAKSIL
jgi:cholestenol delta-isomerase